jgi:phage head maturation protease
MYSPTATLIPLTGRAFDQLLRIAVCTLPAREDLRAHVFRSLAALRARHGSLKAARIAARLRRHGGRW